MKLGKSDRRIFESGLNICLSGNKKYMNYINHTNI